MSKHRKVPSPALVISLIALFVALGSGAYAASKIGTSDLKRNAVTTPKLAKDADSLVDIGTGFMRLALETKTPIVPFAFVGGGEGCSLRLTYSPSVAPG